MEFGGLNSKIVLAVIAGLIIGVGAGYYFGYNAGYEKTLIDEVGTPEKAGATVNVLDKVETNPYEGVKLNPFE